MKNTNLLTKAIAANPDWRDAFKSSNCKVAFNLFLTRPMLEFLCAVSDDVKWDRDGFGPANIHCPDNWVATEASLTKRGLIVRKSQVKIANQSDFDKSFCELTPVGKAVVEMLKIGGLFEEAVRATAKKRSG